MIINRHELFERQPIVGMLTHKQSEHGVSHGLSEAGYDIRIKQDVVFQPRKVSMFRGLETQMCAVINDKIVGARFCLASAIEKFDMPDDLVGIVHDKSTWAREGLSVFNTVIEPGFKGHLTLELVYHGQKPLHIPAGSGIAQVIFHRTAVPCSYQGKYQNQADEPVAAIFE